MKKKNTTQAKKLKLQKKAKLVCDYLDELFKDEVSKDSLEFTKTILEIMLVR